MPTSSSAYRGKSIVNTQLKWDVFVTPSIPVVTTDFAPGEQERPWPPISSTLIYGSQDAVVVDSFITLEQARAQADWIGSTGKNLTTIYATHGHGDHFFGASDVGRMRCLPHASCPCLCRPYAEAIVMPGRQAAPGHAGRVRRRGPLIRIESGGMKQIRGCRRIAPFAVLKCRHVEMHKHAETPIYKLLLQIE
jgi:glyoxylase-like metal-dependent hydrolase (beta-lactamase superfamily II)